MLLGRSKLDKMNIAIIPARGGSKRIPQKNIKLFNGKPLIEWSIEAAKKSQVFDRIIVSTDDQSIANISINAGAEVPFIRPKSISDDETGTTEVVAHACEWLLEDGADITFACCIYASAPLISSSDLIGSFRDINFDSNWDYVFSAAKYDAPIFRSLKILGDGSVEMFYPEFEFSRSQDLPIALHDAAQFYWGRLEAWINRKSIFSPKSKAFIIPNWRVQDIDNEEDWIKAEILSLGINLRTVNGDLC